MKGGTLHLVIWVGFVILLSHAAVAQERWVYRYNGLADGRDEADCVAVGPNGDIYAAGRSEEGVLNPDFTVVSLIPTGWPRWIYRYDGPASDWDGATSIIMGSDGNLYVTGMSYGNGTYHDLTVVSLAASGTERWVYRYDGPENRFDCATSIAMGSACNLYVAGWSEGSGTSSDFIVVSLSDSGTERWVYRYDGPESGIDCATSIAMGLGGNLYAAGYSAGIGTWEDFTVVSLTDSGTERWVYRYDGPGNNDDVAYSIVMELGGNLYAAGYSAGIGTWEDFTVVSLTDSGTERWVYRYDGTADTADVATSIVLGVDGNLYATGWSYGSGTDRDLVVVSLTNSGVERWVYRYDGPMNGDDLASSITVGSDGNIYSAGQSLGVGGYSDFAVVSLTESGGERWIYRYDGPAGRWDWANSVVAGPDSNLYAVGMSYGSGTDYDFTVVSLNTAVGVGEGVASPSVLDFNPWLSFPNPLRRSTLISYFLPIATKVTLSIYDITGRLVETLVNETQQPGIHQVQWNRESNPSGVYFYRLKTGEFVETRKMVVVE